MRRLIDVLAPLGLLVIVGSRWLASAGKTLPGKPEVYLIVGAVLILAHILLRFEEIVKAVGLRQLRYGGNAIVMSVVLLAILVALNYLADRHTKRWDLTKGGRFSLSDQTKKVLQNLKEDVRITYFQKSGDMAAAQDRLKEYQAASNRIKVSFVDPMKDPARARALEVNSVPTLVFERGARREKVTNESEQDVTNALIKVTRNEKKTVCFVEGEGEKDPEDNQETGYGAAKSALQKNQYEVKKVLLLREGKVPGDCAVVIVAGPQKDLPPQALDALRAYVNQGGHALIMVEPEFKESFTGLLDLLKEWNIETHKDVVVDVSAAGQIVGTGPLTPLAAQYPYHEITKDFRMATAFHTARSVEAGKANIPGVTAQNLVMTSPDSWAESDLTLKEPVEYNEGKDRKGPVSLAAVATIRKVEPSPSPSPGVPASPQDAPKGEGRVVAFGDSDFASNALISFLGNLDLFMNSVAYLSQDPDLISIRAKEPDDQRMFLTRGQQFLVGVCSLLIFPGFFVVLGLAAWWRRR
jgi:ABC-type uncharacterized transport system involved in gliding motility auxiliary subunit